MGSTLAPVPDAVIPEREPLPIELRRSRRPIRFTGRDGARLSPLAARGAPEFNGYFNTLWQELEVHVEG